MKPSTQDRTEGKVHEVKGKIKEEVGKVTNDPNLEVDGNTEKNAGKVQRWIGQVEKAVGKRGGEPVERREWRGNPVTIPQDAVWKTVTWIGRKRTASEQDN